MEKKDKAAGLSDKNYSDFLRFEYFDNKHAERYDKWICDPHSYYFEKRQTHCVKLMSEARRGDRVLDIGCGTGKYLLLMAAKTRFVVGVDFSSDFLRKAKLKVRDLNLNRKIDLILCDASSLPFRESVFDETLCINTVQYIPDDLKLFREICRVTKTDGRVIIDGLCKTELRLGYPILNFRNFFRKLLKKKPIGLYKNYYTHWGFKSALARSGLFPVKAIGCAIWLPFLTKDYIGVTIPSPHHIFYLFPKLYKYWERMEEKVKSMPPFCYLGTHIMVKAKVIKTS